MPLDYHYASDVFIDYLYDYLTNLENFDEMKNFTVSYAVMSGHFGTTSDSTLRAGTIKIGSNFHTYYPIPQIVIPKARK